MQGSKLGSQTYAREPRDEINGNKEIRETILTMYINMDDIRNKADKYEGKNSLSNYELNKNNWIKF